MKIMSIGAGFVSEHLPYENIKHRIDSANDIGALINAHKPDVLINCIGKTGRPNVDWCESNKEETAFSNIAVPIMLADRCKAYGVHLIQVGSGCIYFGKSPYKGESPGAKDPGWREYDFAKPESFYSQTKFACDLAIGSMDHVTTLRIRMPISSKRVPRNLISKLLQYKQVIDIPNSMTFMDDLVRCVEWAARNRKTGIYHVTNPQPITAAQIMKEYQKYVPEHTFEIIDEAQLDSLTLAKRSNCILDSSKLARAGFTMTNSQEALESCMSAYVNSVEKNV